MNFSLKTFKEAYPDAIKTWDIDAIKWVSKNKKDVKNKFKELFPKSKDFDFVVQIATNRGSKLLTSKGTVKNKVSGAYLDFADLEELGYEME